MTFCVLTFHSHLTLCYRSNYCLWAFTVSVCYDGYLYDRTGSCNITLWMSLGPCVTLIKKSSCVKSCWFLGSVFRTRKSGCEPYFFAHLWHILLQLIIWPMHAKRYRRSAENNESEVSSFLTTLLNDWTKAFRSNFKIVWKASRLFNQSLNPGAELGKSYPLKKMSGHVVGYFNIYRGVFFFSSSHQVIFH